MNSNLYGNPHSHSPSSMLSTDRIESTRLQALKFFKADPQHFDLIFVANATAAIKLVMDCIHNYSQSQGGFWYGYHSDSHTSLVGIRELADQGSRCFHSDAEVENWLSDRSMDSVAGSGHPSGHTISTGLFCAEQYERTTTSFELAWTSEISGISWGSTNV